MKGSDDYKKIAGKFVFFLLLLTGSAGYCTAQNGQQVFTHLTTTHGLLSNHVTAVCQDHNGFIWIGTNDGLQRYDGNRFLNFRADIRKPDALHQSWITALFEDSKHRFWVGAGSPYIFNRSQNSFYNYNIQRKSGTPVVDGVYVFAEEKKGTIWVMNKDSYYRLNDSTNQFEDQGASFGIGKGARPSFMRKDGDGNLWFVTTEGISCLQWKNGNIVNKNNNPGMLAILDQSGLFSTFNCIGNDIWYSYIHSSELYCYSAAANQVTVHLDNKQAKQDWFSPSFERKISSVFTDGGDDIYLLLPGTGIAKYNQKQDQFIPVPINNASPEGFHAEPELFLDIASFVDRDKNIWIAGGRGLNIFSPRKKRFDFYGEDAGNKNDHFPALNAGGFLQDKISGDIFVSYYYPTAGVVRMSAGLVFKKNYLYSKQGKTNIPENQIWCLYQDENGIIWAPNQAKSMLKIDPRTDQVTLFSDTLLYDNINCIQKDKQGDVWLGTWKNGLNKISKESGRISRITQPADGSMVLPRGIFSLCFENDSIIWVGANGAGLLKFNKSSNRYTQQYLFDEKNPVSLSDNVIHSIAVWNKDSLLLATNTGLNFFNQRTGLFSHISGIDGLPGDVVTNIQIDKDRNIWLGCFGGFCRVNLNPLRITRYGLGDGIINTSVERGPLLQLSDGRYLVPTLKGFFSFQPSAIAAGDMPPPPVITGIKIFERDISVDSLLNAGGRLELSYLENSVTIEFTSLLFNVPEKLRYYYKLEGIDKDWVLSSAEQAVHYHQLPAGQYTFSIKCINRDALASERSIPFYIHIRPPFWKTWVFRGLLAITAIGLVLLLLHRQRKRRKEKEQLRIDYERKIAAMEMNALRAQMNPHFIFNSLSAINTFILKNDQENASDYLQKFSSLVRLILDNSRNDWIILANELTALQLYLDLELARFGHSFTYTIETDPEINIRAVMVPPLIIQPYAENAVRHGLNQRKEPGGKLDIKISRENGNLLIAITDNGVGREVSGNLKNEINIQQHRSHGMQITAERLDIVNDVYNVKAGVEVTDLKDEKGLPAGTRILLTIQFKSNAGDNY